jgi:hypothetical protein
MRVLRYRLRHGSRGTGRSPGGEGIERDLQALEDCTVSLITERRETIDSAHSANLRDTALTRGGMEPKATENGLDHP